MLDSRSPWQLLRAPLNMATGDAAACVRALVDEVGTSDSEAIARAVLVDATLQQAVLCPPKESMVPRTPEDVADYKAHTRAVFASQERQRALFVAGSGSLNHLVVGSPSSSPGGGSSARSSARLESPGLSRRSTSSGAPSSIGESGGSRRLSLLRLGSSKRELSAAQKIDGPLRQGLVCVWLESTERWKSFWVELANGEIDWFVPVESDGALLATPSPGTPKLRSSGSSPVPSAEPTYPIVPGATTELRSHTHPDGVVHHGAMSLIGAKFERKDTEDAALHVGVVKVHGVFVFVMLASHRLRSTGQAGHVQEEAAAAVSVRVRV